MTEYPEQINTVEKFNQKSYKEKGSDFIGRVYHVEQENEIIENSTYRENVKLKCFVQPSKLDTITAELYEVSRGDIIITKTDESFYL